MKLNGGYATADAPIHIFLQGCCNINQTNVRSVSYLTILIIQDCFLKISTCWNRCLWINKAALISTSDRDEWRIQRHLHLYMCGVSLSPCILQLCLTFTVYELC